MPPDAETRLSARGARPIGGKGDAPVSDKKARSAGAAPPVRTSARSAAGREFVRSSQMMNLVALSVGGPQRVDWRGETVRTSIFKERVAGLRHVAFLNIDGDEQ